MNNVVQLESRTLSVRADHIRSLMMDMVKNTLSIGEELSQVREQFPPTGPKGVRQGWRTWLKEELNISQDHAKKLIAIWTRFGEIARRGDRLPSARVLEMLTKEVPESAKQEILKKVAKGEIVGRDKAKKIIKQHLPSPKKANEIARETGKPTAASDGYVYLGADPKKVSQAAERRTVVYAVREAVNCIANIKLSAADFLEYALPHQLWKASNEQEIDIAIEWLTSLRVAWRKRK